ncbi:YceI family protein [Parafilimonas sp.]|uniref:YceI family protein n=1 Tax=Parafilimonas sp. TaxID=1969739 RepID=UPI0039E5C305
MSKTKQLAFIFSAALITFTACTGTSDKASTTSEQEAAAATGKAYTADTAASVINWHATHKGGFAPRYGTLKISDGNVSVENGTVTGGTFTVDVNSLWVDPASVTEKDKKATDLQAHLKSPDFFDASKYPTVKFVVTGVTPYDSSKVKSLADGATNLVSGNLTVKDSTVNITFPARITISDANVDIAAKFIVDRTSWGLKYGAKGDPSDWLISKDFELALDIKATAK